MGNSTKRFPTAPSNPVQRYFSWQGAEDAGYLSYWDKQQEQEVRVDFPFTFLPLKKLACISGFNKQQEENIYSNEVGNLKSEVLNVRVGKNTVAQGLYQDIKDTVKVKGGKYTSSVYIAFKDDSGTLKIGNIKFRGASLGPWIDLQNSAADLSTNAVVIKGAKLDESGSIHFQYPVFDVKPVTDETNQQADQLYEELTEYINYKIERNEVETPDQKEEPATEERKPVNSTVDIDDNFDDMDDDLPF